MAERYVPTWRRPKPKRTRLLPRWSVAVLSLAAFSFAMLPLRTGELNVPISIHLAEREWHAWAMVVSFWVILAILARSLARSERWISAGALVVEMVGLMLVGLTDPRSLDHLFVFIVTAVVAVVWLLLLAKDLEDPGMQWMAYGSAAGVLLSAFFMGYGERLLVSCSLAGANLLYYGYFVDE